MAEKKKKGKYSSIPGAGRFSKSKLDQVYKRGLGAYYSSGALPMDGYICNVGYWSAALTEEQIKSIMWKQHADLTTGTGSESENLVSWWNLDTDANDSHGSNNGTLT